MSRTRRIDVRVSEEEYAHAWAASQMMQMTVSELLRALVLAIDMDDEAPVDSAWERLMEAMG